MTDQIDIDAPRILKQLNTFINLTIKNGQDEALVYAVAQLLHDRIRSLDIREEEKGALVSQLISNFSEFNKVELALWKELVQATLDRKTATTH